LQHALYRPRGLCNTLGDATSLVAVMSEHLRLSSAVWFGLQCDKCHGGPAGELPSVLKHIEEGQFVCRQCLRPRPAELAYLDALSSWPFTNCFLLANVLLLSIDDVRIGRPHRVTFGPAIDELHYVKANANATFPVRVAAVDENGTGFTILSATDQEPWPENPVRIAWMVSGYRGPEPPVFVRAISRAFQLLHRPTLLSNCDFRLVLLEVIIAHELFTAWCLRPLGIRERRIRRLTNGPLRSVLSTLDLYQVFKLCHIPVVGGQITVDGLIADLLKGINLRNKVVHEGLENVDSNFVRHLAGLAYFLMEAKMLEQIPELQPPPVNPMGAVG